MKKIITLLAAVLLCIGAMAQTLNVAIGNVTYKFPATQTGEMTYADGSTLTIMGKVFAIDEISGITIDNSAVADGTISVDYDGASAQVIVAGNIAKYVTPAVEGAHVSIAQSEDLAQEITYTLSGSSADGEFYTSGAYKATIELNGLNLTNATPVYSGAAVHVQNSKRIKVKVITGTTNWLTDASSGSQKGCLYIKGHAEFAQYGTLNVVGNVKHAIKTGEYCTVKNATLNVTSAVGDGISCNQYFLIESGNINIEGTDDDGIQCDLEGTNSTGETTDHEDEDTGNIYIQGGNITINCPGIAAKGIKAAGDIFISGGNIDVTTTGKGMWDTEDLETKAACGISADGNITISGGTSKMKSTGSGGKGMKCDGVLTVTDGTLDIVTTGALYYNNGTTENTNYTGNTDKVSSDYYSSPKGIKVGLKTQSGNSYTYSGGIDISGGTIIVATSGRNAEGIESKNYINISGGHITVNAYDDGINSAQDMTISGGYIYSRAMNNDGLDANGNCYIKGGVVFAIGASSPEVAIDANSEEQKKLYVSGGTIVAIGGLESGASLTQACYQASQWSKNTWYALYNGDQLALAFHTPASGGSRLVLSTSGTTTLKSGVSVTDGTEYFGGEGNIGGTISGGSSVSLSTYSNTGGGGGGGGGFRP